MIVGIISAFVPDDFFAGVLGTGIGAMLVMMLLGMPMYVCATASVPIAAALIAKGVTPGAAFVFLMTGPATNAASIATIWKIMGRRTAIIYMGTVVVCALLAGLALDEIVTAADIDVEPAMGRMLPGYAKSASALVLLGILGYAIFKPKAHAGHNHSGHDDAPEEVVLAIQGMTCAHCTASAESALRACPGVDSVGVDLAAKTASVVGVDLHPSALIAAVKGCGFSARIQSE